MLKKTISYTDYDGNKRTEDFYFNLNRAELIEMTVSEEGGFEKYLRKIISERDNEKLIKIFKEIILKSYGEKSLDGKRFVKSEELATAFSQTEAYSELFTELASDADAAQAFVNGVLPAEMTDKVDQKDYQKKLSEITNEIQGQQ